MRDTPDFSTSGGRRSSRLFDNQWYVAAVLMFVMALAYLDRSVLSLLVISMQQDLGFSDVQMGLLLGPAFTVTFALAGLPMGHWADQRNRRNLLVTGLLVWSAGTILSGLTHSFVGLLLARATVGIGEACVVPCCFSIVADCFPLRSRGRATAVVTLGVSLGAGGALFGGGYLLQLATTIGTVRLPLGGSASPWQLVFLACGLPGLFAALLLMTVREPPREMPGGDTDLTKGSFVHFLRDNRRPIIVIMTAYVMFVLIQNALTAWMPTLLGRRLGLSGPDAAYALGATVISMSPIGAIVGGLLGDAMSARRAGGRYRMSAWLAPIFLPGAILAAMSPSLAGAIIGMMIYNLTGAIIGTSVYAAFQDITPGRFRGRILALYALIANLIGLGAGPAMVALITEGVFRDQMYVHYSLIILVVPACLIAIGCFWFGLSGFARLAGQRKE